MLTRRIGAWIVWGAVLGIWTYLLLSLSTAHEVRQAVPSEGHRFYVVKVIHFGAYAALSFALPFLSSSSRVHTLGMVFLMLHGAITELIQPSFGRSGEFRDFLFDSLGVVTGLLVATWLRSRP